MSDPVRWTGQMPSAPNQAGGRQPAPGGGAGDGSNLADILERVLDKGIVIAGDIQINLLDIELLTIKLRLVVASVDRAKEMGIDWWERDPTLSSGHRELEEENQRLRERLDALEGRTPASLRDGDDADDAEPDEDAEPDAGDELLDEGEVPEDEVLDGELVDDDDDGGADDGAAGGAEREPEPARPRRRTTRGRGSAG